MVSVRQYPVTMNSRRTLSLLAWTMLSAVVLVVSSGAVVRATNSGAGCGASWPGCDQQLFPIPDSVEQLIEFTHRLLTAGLVLGGIVLIVVARRILGRQDPVTRAAIVAFAFLIFESMLGASLVLFGWVDQDASIGRLIVVPLHLFNTFALIAAYALTAWRAAGRSDFSIAEAGHRGRTLMFGLVTLLVIAGLGALNALADTLFPADSLESAFREEFQTAAPFLLQVRVLHPLVAIAGGLGIVWIVRYLSIGMSDSARKRGRTIVWLVVAQFGVGLINIALLTPLELQVIHLLLADLLWIAYLFYVFEATVPRVVEKPVEVSV